MPTIIDALVVTLGLDASQFKKGQDETETSFAKTKDKLVKSGSEIEKSGKGAASSIESMVSGVLKLAAVIGGTEAFKKFIDDMTKLGTQLSNVSTVTGISAGTFTKFEMAAQAAGGSAESIRGTFSNLADVLARFKLYGEVPAQMIRAMARVQSLTGVDVRIHKGDENDPSELMLRWADAAKKLSDTLGPAAARNFLKDMGIADEATIAQMIQGRDAFKAYTDQFDKYKPPAGFREDAKKMTEQFRLLGDSLKYVAEQSYVYYEPMLSRWIGGAQKWVDSQRKIIELMKEGNWSDVFVREANRIIGAVNGIIDAANKLSDFLHLPGHDIAHVPLIGEGGGSVGSGTSSPGSAYGVGIRRGSSPTGGATLGSGPRSGSGGSAGWWTPDRTQHAIDYLKANAGLSDVAAKGLVARWAGVESTAAGPNASNNIGGGHYGIAQWSRSRFAGQTPGDFDGQLAHVVSELKSTEGRAYQTLLNAKTDRDAAVGASQYERAEGYNGVADSWVGRTLAKMRRMTDTSASAATPSPYGSLVGVRGLPQTGAAAALQRALQRSGAKAAPDLTGAIGPQSQNNSSTSNSVHVGELHVHTQATDAQGIAQELPKTMKRYSFANQFNYGIT